MRDLLLKKRRHLYHKDRIVFGIFVFIASALFAGQAMAINLDLFGSPLTFKGYVSQSVQFGCAGDQYDTMSGFQQAITQALLEAEYYASNNLKVFVSGMLYKDWAYNIYDGDDDWKFKTFDESRNEMSLRTDYEDVLKECHVTWTPGDFNLRVGKQIVVWGRMDGTRIMDQINPKDVRLGASDVEFETSIIPIWLAKLEYYPQIMLPFVDEYGIEFVFNPNADFIGDKAPATGNYEHGIWAADNVQSGFRMGALRTDYEEPDKWNSDGYEYAFRIKGTLQDSTYFTLNFFDGVDDNPVFALDTTKGDVFGLSLLDYQDDKGNTLAEPNMMGYYPDKRFAGFTFARDIKQLYIESLGGVAPLVRCEFIYEFDSHFSKQFYGGLVPTFDFVEKDAIYWGLGVDWKFKWNLLNPRRYFTLMPQFMHRHIQDYPSDGFLMNPGGETVPENWYTMFCMLMTYYMHDKLTPAIIYMRDVASDVSHVTDGSVKYDMWLFKLKYEPNHIWSYKAQLTLMNNDGNEDLRGMDHKDNISFTVQYQF